VTPLADPVFVLGFDEVDIEGVTAFVGGAAVAFAAACTNAGGKTEES
jgi:hypothetical protein